MHQETSTPDATVTSAEDVLLTPAQMDRLYELLRERGDTATLNRIESARKGFDAMRVNEILDAFGDPEADEERAVNLLRTIVHVTTGE